MPASEEFTLLQPLISAQCGSTPDGSMACSVNDQPLTDGQEPAPHLVSPLAEVLTVATEADSTTSQSLNSPPAKKQRRTGSKKHPCEHQGCGCSFKTPASLSTHRSLYHSGEQTCAKCGERLSSKQALTDHEKSKHSGEQTCDKCGKRLPSKQALNDHNRSKHSGEQTCAECGKKLSSKQANWQEAAHKRSQASTAGSKPAPSVARSCPERSPSQKTCTWRELITEWSKHSAGSKPAPSVARSCPTTKRWCITTGASTAGSKPAPSVARSCPANERCRLSRTEQAQWGSKPAPNVARSCPTKKALDESQPEQTQRGANLRQVWREAAQQTSAG